MRKDDLMALRERVLRSATAGIAKKHREAPQPDSRWYPQEIDGEIFWVDRLSYPDLWPHAGHGRGALPMPGLRYEVWYFQKRDVALLALLCASRPPLDPLAAELDRTFTAFAEDGRYARRYRSTLDRSPEAELIGRVEPGSRGIWRTAPPAEEKLAKALETLVTDTAPAIDRALKRIDPDGRLPAAFLGSAAARDPFDELQSRFNKRL